MSPFLFYFRLRHAILQRLIFIFFRFQRKIVWLCPFFEIWISNVTLWKKTLRVFAHFKYCTWAQSNILHNFVHIKSKKESSVPFEIWESDISNGAKLTFQFLIKYVTAVYVMKMWFENLYWRSATQLKKFKPSDNGPIMRYRKMVLVPFERSIKWCLRCFVIHREQIIMRSFLFMSNLKTWELYFFDWRFESLLNKLLSKSLWILKIYNLKNYVRYLASKTSFTPIAHFFSWFVRSSSTSFDEISKPLYGGITHGSPVIMAWTIPTSHCTTHKGKTLESKVKQFN